MRSRHSLSPELQSAFDPPTRPFLDKLETGEKTCGLSLFRGYLNEEERIKAFEIFNAENSDFPWDLKPKLYGTKLDQHAFYFDRKSKKNQASMHTNTSMYYLDQLCQRLEKDFDVRISDVFCNRFHDSTHNIPFHKDTFGSHIFVLTLGSQRRVEWRENKTKALDSVTPESGDIYFMPLALNKTHKHRVCAAEGDVAGPRISFVFFAKAPKYAKDYKVSFKDKMVGLVDGILAGA